MLPKIIIIFTKPLHSVTVNRSKVWWNKMKLNWWRTNIHVYESDKCENVMLFHLTYIYLIFDWPIRENCNFHHQLLLLWMSAAVAAVFWVNIRSQFSIQNASPICRKSFNQRLCYIGILTMFWREIF